MGNGNHLSEIFKKGICIMAIPKRIFYVWGANENKRRDVELCLLTWRQKCPDYEIVEINEESIEYFNFQEELKTNKWFKTVYENKLFAYIADYIRIKVLYDNGGIYLDTDVSTLKNFDEYLNEPAFVGMQKDSKSGLDNLEPAILGAKKGNVLLKQILDFYDKGIWELPIYTMPQVFNHFITKNYGEIIYPEYEKQEIIKLNDITIYPEKYLIPMRCGEEFGMDCIKSETTTIHWFGGSWTAGNIKTFLQNKHKVPLEKLIKQCFVKKTYIDNPFIKVEKQYQKFSINIDGYYMFRFKYQFYGKQKYLILYVLGLKIRLFKVGTTK